MSTLYPFLKTSKTGYKSKLLGFLTCISIFYFIAIFEIIVSLLLMCSLLLYVKRIVAFNEQYGRYAFVLGVVFIVANVLAGSLNFYLGSGGWANVVKLKHDSMFEWCLLFIPYYSITEFAPGVIFGIVMQKYWEATTVRLVADEEEHAAADNEAPAEVQ